MLPRPGSGWEVISVIDSARHEHPPLQAPRQAQATGRPAVVPAGVVGRPPSLPLVSTGGVANAAIGLNAAADDGFTVCGITGWAGAVSTVEHAWS